MRPGTWTKKQRKRQNSKHCIDWAPELSEWVSPFDQESQNFVPPQQSYTQQYYAPAQDYGSQNYGVGAKDFDHRRRLNKRYSRIANNFNSLEQVTEALACAGLESSNLIVGIDFTKRNEWTGAKSFRKRSLHHIGGGLNPYEQAISIIGKTLSAFDEDNLIPCFGFGDGPTSFAPVIEMAMTIVEQSGGQYHVLVIIVDGQVQHCVLTSKRKDQAFERQFQLP
ncbi:hypothetical protein CMV_001887 [Castanea mollissima]|uniref:Copine C-terminal domain-containing protein n=1 Tax=Castanea mollissima TaxID=60419 RepID=A0A8J4S245_9ROSI|nr:hypothetical protein CMV_001887 [Castanea mollissima]